MRHLLPKNMAMGSSSIRASTMIRMINVHLYLMTVSCRGLEMFIIVRIELLSTLLTRCDV